MFQKVSAGGRGACDAIVVGVTQSTSSGGGVGRLGSAAAALDADGSIARALKREDCTGEFGRVCEAYPGGRSAPERVLVVGLGKPSDLNAGSFFRLAAIIGKRMAVTKDRRLCVEVSDVLKKAKVDSAAAGQAFGEGFGVLAFNFDELRGSVSAPKSRKPSVTISSEDGAFVKGVRRGLGLAESMNLSRRCSNTPANIATPNWMAAQARKMARGVDNLSVSVVKGEALKRERLTGMMTVGQASENPPCLVRIAYKPRTGASKKPIVLVGKTITYDTGGLSLKVGGSMRGMKGDKDGGCAVLGAMHAIATVIKPKRPVIGLLCAAENSVSDNAYRPDDVLTFRNGVTVEVTNTDAEGRLVLADGLCWAGDKEKAAEIVDVATLTGGVVVALGSTYAGMWCDDDGLRGRMEQASERCDERVWRLPHHQEYRDLMRSSCADILNSAPVRKAHPIQGAAFLSYFAPEGTPWCHLDIAGVHRVEGESGPFAKETPTGFGVRLLANYVERSA